MLCPRCGSEAPDWVDQCDNCGLALIETKRGTSRLGPFAVGDVVAERYEIRDRLGAGPLCWAYAAFDQEEERAVSLDVIKQTILPKKKDHEAFVDKATPLLTLDAEGIASLLRIERARKMTVLVSERVSEGHSLRALVDARRQGGRVFSAEETVLIATVLAEALESGAAVSGHGSLSPSSIIVRDSDLVLLSYGVAPCLPREETVRALAGAPTVAEYVAPEVVEGATFDPRSDIYSLAAIACELLTGRVPAVAGHSADFLGNLPSMAEETIRRALAPAAEERDASPLELVEALAAVLGVDVLRRDGLSAASLPEAETLDQSDLTVPSYPSPVFEAEGESRAPLDPSLALDDETESEGVPTDPSLPAEPDPAGTQEITPEMMEALDGDDSMPRDPAVPAEPSKEGTQQITPDMLEEVGEDGDSPTEPHDVEAVRSLGLDPRLVRAARKLDGGTTGDSDEVPTLRQGPGPSRRAEADGVEQREAEEDDTDVQPQWPDGGSESAAAVDVEAPTEAVPSGYDPDPPAPEAAEPTSSEARDPGRISVEPVPREPIPVVGADASASRADEDLEDLHDETQIDSRPSAEDAEVGGTYSVPAGLANDSVGPLQTAASGRAVQEPTPATSRRESDLGHLPAVVVDSSLAGSSRPIPDDMVTHRVPRASAEPRITPYVAPKPAPRGAFKGWMLPLIVVAAIGTLFLGMALAIVLLE